MNHKKMTLGLIAIVAAVALTASAFGIPQQAFAHKYHHNHNNGIDVDQQINQLNACTNSSLCENNANNNVDIDR
jgi:hypothetical protein